MQTCILLCNYVQLVSTIDTPGILESLGVAFLQAFHYFRDPYTRFFWQPCGCIIITRFDILNHH